MSIKSKLRKLALILVILLVIVVAVFALIPRGSHEMPPTAVDLETSRNTVTAIFGASGTVGDGLLKAASNDPAVEKIHVIGYSAGTRMVSRVLADLGMYGYSLSKEEIDARVKLGNVILIGSDVDRNIMSGYLVDGALRIPDSLTLYQSQDDGALNMSKRVFRHDRSGQMVIDGPMSPEAEKFFADHPQLWIVDVTNAEGGTEHGGHSYFRTSPWVSSDILMTLMYSLSPEQRGLVRYEDFPVWDFPEDYVTRLRASLAEVNPSFGEAIRQNESPPGETEEER